MQKNYVRRTTVTTTLLQLEPANFRKMLLTLESTGLKCSAGQCHRQLVYAATLTSFKATVWPFFQGVLPTL